MDTPTHSIDHPRLADVMRWPRNPKDHDIGALTESYDQFGYVAPILVNRSNGTILAGHGRLDALWDGFTNGQPPPMRIGVDDQGEWLVPVVMVDLNPDQHEAYLVADNRHTELGGWQQDLLYNVLRDLAQTDQLPGTGYDGDDVDNLAFLYGELAGATRPALPPPEQGVAGEDERTLRVVVAFEDEHERAQFFQVFNNGPAVERAHKVLYHWHELMYVGTEDE
jgi:ParB-like chromosome segregation protein Spo0J